MTEQKLPNNEIGNGLLHNESIVFDTTIKTTMYKDFIRAQKEFKPVVFNRVNPFHKSRYADLGSHLASVTSALNNNNLSLVQKTHDCDHGVCVETILYHSSGEFISGGLLRIPVVKNDPQGHGAALTYARRFSLGSLLSLYGEEDNDGNEHAPEKQSTKPVNKPILQQKIDNIKQDKEISKLKRKEELILDAEKNASSGMEALQAFWRVHLSNEDRELLKNNLEILKLKAKEADELNQDVGA